MVNIRVTKTPATNMFQVSGFDAAMGRWVPVSGEFALGFATLGLRSFGLGVLCLKLYRLNARGSWGL